MQVHCDEEIKDATLLAYITLDRCVIDSRFMICEYTILEADMMFRTNIKSLLNHLFT